MTPECGSDEGRLRVQLLGAVRAWRAGRELKLGAPRQRAVLAVLAMQASKVVTRADLVDALWDDPPKNAVNSLHVYVQGLRGVLEPGRGRRSPGNVLVTAGPGYTLRLGHGDLDVQAFEEHQASARGLCAQGDLAGAVRALEQALALWQGEPLAGITGPWAVIQRARLSEARLAAVEERAGVMLALGCHGELVAELRGLVGEYPLRERFRCLLMLALYRCGRQADALESFHDARRVLDAELGITPGPELSRLHQQILTGDPALAACAGGPAVAGGPAQALPVPRELPLDVTAFTGRSQELGALDRLLAEASAAGEGSPAAVISAVSGTAGVGKTALAVRWAHRVRGQFPDGQLYVNLRGYDPGQPVSAADALAGFLRSLGVADKDIPARVDERSARYRSLLAGKRVLVLLDNAREAEQVRPLLPGTPTSVVVVTSRDSLAGLVAGHGARRVDLSLLSPADAVSLLRALIGDRAGEDAAAAATLADRCARLPLALRVAAELAVSRPAVPLADLARELAGRQRRLDMLSTGGDPRTAVRSVLSWSYHHLSPPTARLFRAIGLHPGPDFDLYAAAALGAATLEHAGAQLDLLARGHLIQPARAGRYGMHDLLRAYAGEQATRHDHAADRRAALTRLFDYYLHTAAVAMDALVPAERYRRPRVPGPATPVPPLAGAAAGQAWLDAERHTLVAAAAYTAAHGWPGHTVSLAAIVFRYFEYGGHYTDALVIHRNAREAAREAGSRAAEAAALNHLGMTEEWLGRLPQAQDHLEQAVALFREVGDKAGEARALVNLAGVGWLRARYRQAAGCVREALTLYAAAGDRVGEAGALTNLGSLFQRLGDYEEARKHHQRALALFRGAGHRNGVAHALNNLGTVASRLGRHEQASSHHEQALGLFRETGYRHGQAHALTSLGMAEAHQGRCERALECHEQAVALFREAGNRSGEAEAVNGLAETLLASDQSRQARAMYQLALRLAGEIGDQYQQARAHSGLARCHEVTGDRDREHSHRQHASTIYGQLGVPPATAVARRLQSGD